MAIFWLCMFIYLSSHCAVLNVTPAAIVFFVKIPRYITLESLAPGSAMEES